ncbi:(2Fe-2S) ferredoxin domain-containing protein [Pimelobacter simplex]|uniref:(2Fe-2S) ferredoxin domain-containing protein n=1 Tax=Nocardioides simplex TaxID=2045 RepID=A0A7J5E445_NOCSI|nr:(2Fe-2S) ferredoxin domain-containing protein [Pimelobacter simplex]KAB2813018.1 (2Fe-2S) ferredoxin domain-containing protein [Pimelobacter simplex]
MAEPRPAVVLVVMGAEGARHAPELDAVARATGATLAYLQLGTPSLAEELDRLRAAGTTRVELVGLSLGAATARSWLRRVAGHWRRAHPEVEVVIDERAVTGTEAALTSSAWEEVPGHARQVLVCRGPRCSARGSGAVLAAVDDELRRQGLGDDDVLVTQTGCLFPCNQAPVVVVHPEDAWYGGVTAESARAIVVDHPGATGPAGPARLRREPAARSSPAPRPR